MRLAHLQIAFAALALGAAPALAQDKVRFQTDWIPSGEHAMYYGGWQKGIFAAEGIDVTITRGYGSGDTVTKLAGGGFDFGVADKTAIAAALDRLGLDYVEGGWPGANPTDDAFFAAMPRTAARACSAVLTSYTACNAVVPLRRTASGPPLGGAIPGMNRNLDACGNLPAV